MRTISPEQAALIEEARAEGIIALRAAILEKDILVTEALRAISEVKLPGFDLTFSGGTCLAKAYGLVERMSEDIDLRLQIDGYKTLSRSALRRSLSELKKRLANAFGAAQFGLPDGCMRARNENRFVSFELAYQSRFPPDVALRSTVRVEFMAIPPRLTPTRLTMAPLMDRLTQRTTAAGVTLPCLSIDETYCEKIISYLRRATEHLVGRPRSQYEERLARHVYDVHRIVTERPRRPTRDLQLLFNDILATDVEQYGNRIDGFRVDAAAMLRRTLVGIPQRPEFREHYERFVAELVYGGARPGFDEAFTTFAAGADALLQAARSSAVREPPYAKRCQSAQLTRRVPARAVARAGARRGAPAGRRSPRRRTAT
ncbi:MAG TPA: nucleotidyl transferase AbiEii/AbiGii toxin family protein [Steroidobacteraceae bacterium]|nr:nucleotidyl transferase AbiEii/AbiGii toxin family protein [Steroidobacteraceae bacterium]